MEQERTNFAPVETINGRQIALGAMALSDLVALAEECHERLVEAQTDYQIVQYTIDYMYPDGSGEVA